MQLPEGETEVLEPQRVSPQHSKREGWPNLPFRYPDTPGSESEREAVQSYLPVQKERHDHSKLAPSIVASQATRVHVDTAIRQADQLFATHLALGTNPYRPQSTSVMFPGRANLPSGPGSEHVIVQEEVVPGRGLCYVYEDGAIVPKVPNVDSVNPKWGTTKAGKPRKRLGQACDTCREKKIKCDPSIPKCAQCQKFGRKCKFDSMRKTTLQLATTNGTQAGSLPNFNLFVPAATSSKKFSKTSSPSSFDEAMSLSREWQQDSSGEESFMFNSQSPPPLDHQSQEQLERIVSTVAQDLMKDFLSAAHGMTTCTLQSSNQSSSGSNNARTEATPCGSSSESGGSGQQLSPTRKRGSGQNDEGGGGGRKKPRLNDADEDETPLDGGLFACPYGKADPNRFSETNENPDERKYRRCRSVCLTSIPRLKQHLYRVHRRPEHHCSSCYTIFDSALRCEEHARSRPACNVATCPFDEKMTQDQYTAIKRRKMREPPAPLWYAIFGILFPGAEPPDTPYVCGTNSPEMVRTAEEFGEFLESRMQDALATRLSRELYNSDDAMSLFYVNVALEATLPSLLRELYSEFNDNSDGPHR